ncbi:MAG: sulfate adenylyltransferase [Phycisphaerae bacterium]
MSLIEPHGGKLVSRIVDTEKAKSLLSESKNLPVIALSSREQCDLEMIAIGAFSPLAGFVGEEEFYTICNDMLLPSGLPWPVPITCTVTNEQANQFNVGGKALLVDDKHRSLAVLTITSKYKHNKDLEAEKIYKTLDKQHPGVAIVYSEGDICLGGPIDVISPNYEPDFTDYRLTPAQTRAEFGKRGWQSVVAFQTRNPIHRAHEYLTKCALETCDGLLIHPLVGQTKSDDIPADVRMKCYNILLEDYYPASRVLLSVMPSAMRYAGPREAILHAIIRKNYGCTHFIVGRDHAGVGNYYGTYDAQKIFDQIDSKLLAIEPMKFEHSFYCKTCQSMTTTKTCGHDKSNHIFLSGTKVREMLSAGQLPPTEFTRPEVAQILIAAYRNG